MRGSDNLCTACRTIDFDDAFNFQKNLITSHPVAYRRICDVNYALDNSVCRLKLCSIIRPSVLENLPLEVINFRRANRGLLFSPTELPLNYNNLERRHEQGDLAGRRRFTETLAFGSNHFWRWLALEVVIH